jgi:hypothetical protein
MFRLTLDRELCEGRPIRSDRTIMTNALETVALAADRAGYGLGARGTGVETARDGLAAFLSTDYEGGCNRRIATIDMPSA